MRLLTTVIVAAVVLGGFTQRVSAEHHHQAFWDYLAGGSWEYEWKGGFEEKGTAKWRLNAKGKALIGRFETADGSKEVEVTGYRADTKSTASHGFSSNGSSWHITWTEYQPKVVKGKGIGTFPDGRQFETAYTITITSDDRMEIESSGTVGGKPYTASAVFEKTK